MHFDTAVGLYCIWQFFVKCDDTPGTTYLVPTSPGPIRGTEDKFELYKICYSFSKLVPKWRLEEFIE